MLTYSYCSELYGDPPAPESNPRHHPGRHFDAPILGIGRSHWGHRLVYRVIRPPNPVSNQIAM
jgi:hypothetical protein